MSNYNLTAIKMNVDLGSTKKVIDQYNALVKQLETKQIKLNIDVSSVAASVASATKEIEKVYQQEANAKMKAEKNKSDAVKQTHESAMRYLRQQQDEIQKTYNASSKLTYNQDPKTGQITSAMISFTNEIGKAETKMYQLKESMEKLNVFGQEMKVLKLDIVNQKNIDDTVKINTELEKLAFTTQKVKDTMANKMNTMALGNEWIKDLQSFKTLESTVNSFNPTSMKNAKEEAYGITQAFKDMKLEVSKIKLDDKLYENLEKVIASTQKIKDTMGNKMSSMTLGNEWIKDLDSFKKLEELLKSLDPTSMKQLKSEAYDIAKAFNDVKLEASKVKLDNKLYEDLEKVIATTQKLKDTMNNKMTNMSLGNEWIKDLPSFKKLETIVNSFDPTSMKQAKNEAYAITQVLKQLEQEVNKIKLGEKITADIGKAQNELESFVSSINQKMTNITIGKDGDWATKLSQFQQLQSEMTKLSSMQANGTNLNEIATQIDKVNALYAQTTTEITRVNQLNAEMSSKYAFNQDVTNKVADYNRKLDEMIAKNQQLASNPAIQKIRQDVERLNQVPPTEFSNTCKQIDLELKKVQSTMTNTATNGAGLFAKLGSSIKSAFSFMTGSMIIYKLANEIRQIPNEIKNLDTALVDLKKTTTMSNDELDRFYLSSNEIAKQLGVTTKEVIEQASAWSRLGYSTKEQAETMAEVSSIFKSISPNMSMDNATDGLISTMKAFNIEANDALDGIVSKINIIGNTQAVSNADIVEFLTRSSSAMSEANNSLEETIALGTAATEITRDAASVGQILKTTSMRIRGYSEETEAYTEDVTVLSGKIADLTKTASNMSGVSLFTDETRTEYKSTYKLLEEISGIYDELSDKQQADLLEALAGKRNGQAIAAIINNFSAAQKSIESMANSQGNAMKEMEIIYDSIDYKLNKLRETWTGLSQDFLDRDMFKSFIDGTTGILDMIDACGGLETVLVAATTAFIALKLASVYLTHGSIVGGIKNIVKELFVLKTVTNATTGATLALSAAQKTLIGLGIGAVIMGIGAAIHYMSKSTERAEENFKNLNKEISDINKKKDSADALAKRYDELAKKQNLSNEEQQEFIDIQNELHELMPEINGYYDEAGNYIIIETDLIKKLNDVYEELIDTKLKERRVQAESLASNLENDVSNIGKQLEYEKATLKLLEDRKKELINNSSSFSDEEFSYAMENYDSQISVVKGNIAELNVVMKDMHDKSKQSILTLISSTREWNSATDDQKKALQDLIVATNDSDKIMWYLRNSADSVEDMITSLENAKKAQKDFNNGNITIAEKMSTLDAICKKYGISLEALNGIIGTYEKTANKANEATEANVLSMADYGKILDDIVSKYDGYSKILDELNEANGLSAKTIANIAKEYPELLGYMNDEDTLRNRLIELMGQQEDKANEVYRNMLSANKDYYNTALMQSEEYYSSKILGDEKLYNKLGDAIKQYFDNLGVAYNADLKNYQSLEQAKMDTTKQLITSLAGAWAKYFNVTANSVALDSSFMNDMGAHGTHMYSAYNQLEQFREYQKQFQTLANEITFDGIKLDLIGGGKKGSSGSSSKADDPFKAELEKIKAFREKIEREIDELQEAINLDATLGIFDEDKANKMTDLLTKLKGVSEIQIKGSVDFKGYEQLQKIYTKQEQLAELEALISDARRQGFIDESTYHEHMIDLINKKHEVEKRAYDDRVRLIELEQQLYNESSNEYQTLEKEKLDLLIGMQVSYMAKVRALKEQGLSDEHEDVRKYIDMWYSAEQERLNIIKDMAEQIRNARLEALKDEGDMYATQKKASEDLLKLTMDMIKKENDAKRQAIEDDFKAREDAIKREKDERLKALKDQMDATIDALKKEIKLRNDSIKEQISNYKRIIDAKKEALRDESDERSYNKGLSEKQKKIKDTEDKLLALELDTSLKAQAEKKKLQEELAKYREELDDYQYDNSIKKQEEALDDEFKQYEDAKNKELDEYNKIKDAELEAYKKQKEKEIELYTKAKDAELAAYKKEKDAELAKLKEQTATEGALRRAAMEYLKKEGKGAYDALLSYSSEYTSTSQKEFDEMWTSANEAIDAYSNTSMNLIDIMGKLADEIRRVADESERIKAQSWTEFVEDKGSTQIGGGSSSDKPNSGTSINKPNSNTSNNKPSGNKSESSAKSQAQSEQQKYLHNQMLEAKKSNNTGLISWIKSIRPKYGLNPETGAIVKQGYIDAAEWEKIKKKYGFMKGGLTNSTGLHWLDGEVGKPERVLSPQQTKSFDDMVKQLPTFNAIMKNVIQGNSNPITVQIDKLMEVANIDKDVDIDALISKATDSMYKSLNNVFKLNGMSPMR